MTEKTTPPTPDEVDEFLDNVENWHDSMPFYNEDLGKLLTEFRRLREAAPKMRAERDQLRIQVQNYHRSADEHVAKFDRKHEALLEAQRERDQLKYKYEFATKAFNDAAAELDATKPQVYFMEACAAPMFKIGTSRDPKKRVQEINKGSAVPAGLRPGPVVLWGSIPGGFDKERQLHRQFDHLRVSGEWFRDVPELRDEIKRLLKEDER